MALKSPPMWAILACLLLFGFGELAGALLGGFPAPIQNFASERAMVRPDVHGLTGIEDIDRTIIAKVSSETLSRLHTFHLHAHGVGLLTFVLFLVIANAPFSVGRRRILYSLCGLGMLYPFGWLTLMLAIPFLGIEPALRLAERLFFMPLGSALLLAIWILIFFYVSQLVNQFKNKQSDEAS